MTGFGAYGCPGAVVDRSHEQCNNGQARAADIDPHPGEDLFARTWPQGGGSCQ
jgi:hypothetical protein